MPDTDSMIISGGGGAGKKRGRAASSKKKRASPAKKAKYATAKTQAGKYRQVFEGRAELTGPGGLKKSQLTQNSSGKIVSKKKSNKPMNEYMKKASAAAKRGAASFAYNGKTYRRATTKSGLVYYTAKGRSKSPSPAKRRRRGSPGPRRNRRPGGSLRPESTGRAPCHPATSRRSGCC